MIIAALAGIKVFATGGIGGVHRGAEHTFDNFCRSSGAGAYRMSRSSVPGAKSILDLGLTTEYLETFGVPLIGYPDQISPGIFLSYQPV